MHDIKSFFGEFNSQEKSLMKDSKVETLVMNNVKSCVEVFEKYGIKATLNKDNKIIISHYAQPKEGTFSELGIDEDKLIENVVACAGVFDARKSRLTIFPLEACQEIKLYDDTNIVEMPNLKAVGRIVANAKLKKMPKLKAAGMISLENSSIKALPKIKEAGILIVQNSSLKELPNLESVGRLCIIDSPIEDLDSLKNAHDVFICSSDENQKLDIKTLKELVEVEKLFVANSTLKSLPSLKKAKKLAFYNCGIKSVKSTICKDVEIETKITDEELSEKFDTFTDWYNSDILQASMNILGDLVSKIKG